MSRCLFLWLTFAANSCYAQSGDYVITGHLKAVKEAKSISLTTTQGTNSVPVSVNGDFSFHGIIDTAQEVRLRADSTSNAYFWLEGGKLTLELVETEIPSNNDFVVLDVLSLSGPPDSYLYYYKLSKAFWGEDGIVSNSIAEAEKIRRDKMVRLIDSIFENRPESNVLPHLIRFFQKALGDSTTGRFYSSLSPGQQATKDGVKIRRFLAQRAALQIGSFFENFVMNDTEGKSIDLSKIHSKYLLIDFWASDCAPCRGNHPALIDAYNKYKDKGLEILGVSLDEDAAKWTRAVKQDKLPWVNLADLHGFNGLLPKKYNINSVPFSVLLDNNKKVIAIDLRGEEVANLLATIVQD